MMRKKAPVVTVLLVAFTVPRSVPAAEVKQAPRADTCNEGSCHANPVIDPRFTDTILKAVRGSPRNQQQGGGTNFVGSYDSTRNFVGFVDLDPSSQTYKGISSTENGDLRFDARTPSRQLDETYLTKKGSPSPGRLDEAAVRAKIAQIEGDFRTSFISFCNQASQKEKASGKPAPTSDLICENMWKERESTYAGHEFVKEWKKEKLTLARGIAIQKLNQAIELGKALSGVNLRDKAHTNSESAHALYERLFEGIEIATAATDIDPKEPVGVTGAAMQFKRFATNTLSFNASRREAGNLLAPAGHATGSLFLSPAELESMKKQGKDTSVLDPADSGLWRRPTWDVSECDIANYGGGTVEAVGREILNPEEPVDLEFKEVPDSAGTTPKLTAKYGGRDYKIKFTVPIDAPITTAGPGAALARASANGTEVQTENVVNRIAACAGWSVDPTYYKRTARMFLDKGPKKGQPAEEYRREFAEKVAKLAEDLKRGEGNSELGLRSAWKYGEALSKVRFDERTGRGFVQLDDVSLEMKSKRDTGIKVGLFTKEDMGRSDKREFRAISVLNALFADADVKAKNTDLRLVADANGEAKLDFALSDMGATLGGLLIGKGRVNNYSPNLVKPEETEAGKVVQTSFRTKHWQPVYGVVTVDDARWAMRRIGQLTPEQIMKAFQASGATPAEAQLYTDKFMRRRDQLMAALFPPETRMARADGTGRTIPFQMSMSKMTDPAKYEIPGAVRNGMLVEMDQPHPDGERKTGSTYSELADAWNSHLTNMGVTIAAGAIQRVNLGNAIFSGTRVDPVTGEVSRTAVRGALSACLPLRTSVPNKGPDRDKYPWMVIDVYQFGPGLTTRASPRGDKADEDISIGYVKEVIKMTPATQPNNDIKPMLANFKNTCDPTKLERELDEATLKSMKPGDKLMVNKYKFAGGGIRLSTNGPQASLLKEMILPEAYFQLGGKGELFDSAFFEMTEDGKVQAAWQKEKRSDFVAGAGVSVIKTFPLFGFSKGGEDGSKTGYEFDMKDKAQADLLARSLEVKHEDTAASKEATPTYQITRERDGRYLLWSAFGFKNRRTSKQSIEGRVNAGAVSREVQSEKRTLGIEAPYSLRTQNRAYEATYINDLTSANQDSTSLQIHLDYERPYASNDDFGNIMKGPMALFPPTAFAGNTKGTVKPALGKFRLDAKLVYTDEALKGIFGASQTPAKACEAFESSLVTRDGKTRTYGPKSLCEMARTMSLPEIAKSNLAASRDGKGMSAELSDELKRNLLEAKFFQEHFESAQKSYAAVSTARESGAGKETVDRLNREHLRNVINILDKSTMPQVVLRTIEKMAPAGSYCRDAKVTSQEGFVDQAGTLTYTDPACAKILPRTLSANEAFEDPAAAYEQMVKPFTFDYFRTQNRRGSAFTRGQEAKK